jgi:Putative Flp pilus-assembly TadE/G-like
MDFPTSKADSPPEQFDRELLVESGIENRIENGFVAVATALLSIVLIVFCALAIDVAVFLVRAQQLQRTADAAALSAVVKMPRFPAAEALAKEIGAKNRIAPSMITVDRIPGKDRDLRVTISDPHVSTFFGKLFRQDVSLKRSARAQYVAQVELGSKLNALGTGNLPDLGPGGVGTTQKFWLAINGFCTPKEDGDRFASAFEGTKTATSSGCGIAPVGLTRPMNNLEYPGDYAVTKRPAYAYTVTIPCPTVGEDPCKTPRSPGADVKVAVYNPFYDPSNTGLDRNLVNPTTEPALFDSVAITTTFAIYNDEGIAVDGTTALNFTTCPDHYDGCAHDGVDNGWNALFTIPASEGAGKFRIEVSTLAAETASFGANVFSLLAYNSSDPFGACSGVLCPTLSGTRSMSVYANASAGATDFYLAKLAPAQYFRGKRVQVLLWDPGEGAESIQILDQNTTPVQVSYRTWNPGLGDPLGNDAKTRDYNVIQDLTASADAHKINVGGLVTDAGAIPPPWLTATPVPYSPRSGESLYNGRMLSMEINIPTDYGCVPSVSPCQEVPLTDDGWWKIRYTTGTAVSDRSTWSVQLLGDPVHLVRDK